MNAHLAKVDQSICGSNWGAGDMMYKDIDGDGKIFVSGLFKGTAGLLATYELVAKNDLTCIGTGDISVSGNVIEFKELALMDQSNVVYGDLISITVSLNCDIKIFKDYVPNYSLVLVYGEDGYALNGVDMFYVEAYGAYAAIVEGEITAETVNAQLRKSSNCETIKPSYDVNCEYVQDGKIDLKDATAVYACTQTDLSVANYMELYLRADVNGDKVVNIADVNLITSNYKN